MDNAIELRGVGKQYRIGLKDQLPETLAAGVLSMLTSPFSNYRRLKRLSTTGQDGDEDVLWALRDLSLDVPVGQVLGVIGGNGAGKSTLLKILARITEPTCGKTRLKGRVASLLEVGTGFHPELTGRENVYLNGTILGMRKREVDKQFDEIVGFSGIEKFIDTPVKRYSSGMRVRLAFSVAAHLEPEILLVDEVLAVGDVAFQKKCLGKLENVASHGRTVLFVSHQLPMITNLCDACLLLENGRAAFHGPTAEAVSRYTMVTNERRSASKKVSGRELAIHRINDQTSLAGCEQPSSEPMVIEGVMDWDRDEIACRIILIVRDSQGNLVVHHTYHCQIKPGRNRFHIKVPPLWLMPGLYGFFLKALWTSLNDDGDFRLISDVCMVNYTGEMQATGPTSPMLMPEIEWALKSE